MELHDLDVDDHRWAAALPVLQELRPHVTAQSLRDVYAEGHPQGYRFLGAFAASSDGSVDRCIGLAGYRLLATVVLGRTLHVDDLVTSTAERSTGVGRALLAELQRRARDAGCAALDLDSGVQRHDAHRFYFRERMHISSHHFTLPL